MPFDRDSGFRLFDSLVDNKWFSLGVLLSSAIGLFLCLELFDGSTFLGQVVPFQQADLYKISLLTQGISPYSLEPWAAPYPPFYFILWSPLFILLGDVFGLTSSEVFLGFRLASVLLVLVNAYLILITLKLEADCRTKAIALASISILCSFTALIYPVGDIPGLTLVSTGCYFLAKNKIGFGTLFVSLAAAFKIQPALGLLFVLIAILGLTKEESISARFSGLLSNGGALRKVNYFKKDFQVSFAVVTSVLFAGVVLPMILMANSLDYFFLYDIQNIQYYSFNVYAALLDIFLNFSSVVNYSMDLDTIWIVVGAIVVGYFGLKLVRLSIINYGNKIVIERGASSYGRFLIDVFALGAIVWLLIMKQTMPHYFLWALVPLLARGRNREIILLLSAEFFGMLFFGLAQAIATAGFQNVQALYVTAPSLEVSILLLAGGIVFDVFSIFAMRSLFKSIMVQIGSENNKRVEILSRNLSQI